MESFQRVLILLPIMVGIVQGIKQLIPEKFYKFLWILNSGLGVLLAFIYVDSMATPDINTATIILGGIVLGLAASGLFETIRDVGVISHIKK